MKPTNANPTGNGLSGLKQEDELDPSRSPGCGCSCFAPPRRFREAAAAGGRRWTWLQVGAALFALATWRWANSARALRGTIEVRPAVHTRRGSFFLRRLEVRP